MNESNLWNLYNTFHKIHNQFSALRRLSIFDMDDVTIYPVEIEVLSLLDRVERISISGISKSLYMTKSGASQLVKKLFRKGLVTKNRELDNERLVIIKMTDRGTEVLNNFFKENDEVDLFFKNVSSLSSPEIEVISQFLNSMDQMYDKKLT